MRNSTQSRFAVQRDAGRCEALGDLFGTHRGAAAVKKQKLAADGHSRNRVKMCLHPKCVFRDEKEWYRGNLIFTFSSL